MTRLGKVLPIRQETLRNLAAKLPHPSAREQAVISQTKQPPWVKRYN
jgi:hypothetical protein